MCGEIGWRLWSWEGAAPAEPGRPGGHAATIGSVEAIPWPTGLLAARLAIPKRNQNAPQNAACILAVHAQSEPIT